MVTQRRARGRASTLVYAILAAVVAALAVVLSAPPSPAQESAAPDGAPLGTNGANAPKIRWADCRGRLGEMGYDCARVEVPLSYQRPDGKKIELALGRLPARDQERKIGTLFWNPGGPGGSGRIPPPFSRAIRERFDIVGFDPRGVGASTPVRCFDSNRQAFRTFARPFPITEGQEGAFFAANERGTELCAENAGAILSHVSTANVARDMDLLRRAVGDEKITYIGFSYGTFLGEVYANLFPRKVRAMTLDAVLDPQEWTTGEQEGQAETQPFTYRLGSFEGSQDALRTFFEKCAAAAEGCAFAEPGDTAADLESKWQEILGSLRGGPVEVTDGGQTFPVTYQDAVGLTLSVLYAADASPFLAEFLEDLHRATRPSGERTTAQAGPPEVDVPDVATRPSFGAAGPSLERPGDRGLRREPYFGIEWFNAVSCADTENPSDTAAWSLHARQADAVAPGFGALWTYASTPCATWPVEDPDRYLGPWDRKTANPLLLIGNRLGDPATPYDDARTTAEERLADARLLTLDSSGHTAAYGRQSRCVDAAVDRYLLEGTLPPEGKVCQPNREPFATGAAQRSAASVPSTPPPPGF